VITARWQLRTPQVPLTRVLVLHRIPSGFDIQLGDLFLAVDSLQHWEDLNAKVVEEFGNLGERRPVPLPRKDSVKPTDYSSVNCSGACYGGDDE
jgi:hypothetical protein